MIKSYTIHILNHNFIPDRLLSRLIEQILPRNENIKLKFWDDGSDEKYQPLLHEMVQKYDFPFINWELRQTNVGRAAMRQKILDHDSKGWMLSIDSDMVPNSDFINQMISSLHSRKIIYTGIHYYQHDVPADHLLLHWNYGRRREVPAQYKAPYVHFSTGIFALHSVLAKTLKFDSSIRSYGHEDTLFGLLIQEKGFSVQRTGMKAVHGGLSSNEDFIKKQLTAVRNLQKVIVQYPQYRSQLVRWAQRIDKLPVATKWLPNAKLKRWCIRKLLQYPDRLALLDVLKLNELLSVISDNE